MSEQKPKLNSINFHDFSYYLGSLPRFIQRLVSLFRPSATTETLHIVQDMISFLGGFVVSIGFFLWHSRNLYQAEKKSATLWGQWGTSLVRTGLALGAFITGIIVGGAAGAIAPFLLAGALLTSSLFHSVAAIANLYKWVTTREAVEKSKYKQNFVKHGISAILTGVIGVCACIVAKFAAPLFATMGFAAAVTGIGGSILWQLGNKIIERIRKKKTNTETTAKTPLLSPEPKRIPSPSPSSSLSTTASLTSHLHSPLQSSALIAQNDEKVDSGIKIFDLNAGFLPTVFGFGINGFTQPSFLTRKKRAQEILNWIDQGDYDVITLQEMFDIAVANKFIKHFEAKGYYCVRGIPIPNDKIGRTNETGATGVPEIFNKPYLFPSVTNKKEEVRANFFGIPVISALRGGLLLMSKFPILEVAGEVFPNPNPHTFDVIVQKGFIAAKLEVSKDQFITVYCSHLGAGGRRQDNEPTNSARRGEQFGFIHHHMNEWEKKQPPNDNHHYSATLFAADTNMNLAPESVTAGQTVNNRRMLSISSGGSGNGKMQNEIKYEGQYKFFLHFQPVVPSNFRNIRFRRADKTYFDKEEAVEEVKNNPDLVSCTDNDAKKGDETRYATHKMLDIVTINNEAPGQITSEVIPSISSKGSLLSDHHANISRWRMFALAKPWTSIYQNQQPQKVNEVRLLLPPSNQ